LTIHNALEPLFVGSFVFKKQSHLNQNSKPYINS